MLLLFSAAALFAGTKKRVQRERERERELLFSCCLIFVEDFFSLFSLFSHFFHFFWLLLTFFQTKTRTTTTHLTKKTR